MSPRILASAMWFDTHCHLDAAEFDADRAAVVDAAAQAGVSQMLVPAVEVANFAAVEALCLAGQRQAAAVDNLQKNAACAAPVLLPAWGIHPMYVPSAKAADLEVLRTWLANKRPVAVGEIGLDGFVPGLDMAQQEYFFAAQLDLAVEFDLPVVLHVRRAQDLVLKHLRRHRAYFAGRGAGRAGIAHAFNGSRQQADMFIELGFCLGFGGAMSFAGSTRIRQLAADLPLEALVLETDAPDIPPAWLGGGRNSPDQLPRLAGVLAELRGVSIREIARATTHNAQRMFGGADIRP